MRIAVEHHLALHITQKYSTVGGLRLVADNTKEQPKWQSTNEKMTKATATISSYSKVF
jgi:hypothetical protein